jgi:hypothetical protein
MPFVGRTVIRGAVEMARGANTKPKKAVAAARLAATVGVMDIGHSAMLALGIGETVHHASLFVASPSVPSALASLIDFTYSLANGGVIWTQTSIAGHVARDLWERRDETPETAVPKEPLRSKEPNLRADMGFTLAGQAVFIATII